jgi:hypothetical protein
VDRGYEGDSGYLAHLGSAAGTGRWDAVTGDQAGDRGGDRGGDDAAAGVARRLQARLDRHTWLLERLQAEQLYPEPPGMPELQETARRMRRDTESLLLLAGHEPGVRSSGPRPLGALVSDAAAVAEEPRRVDVRSAPAARVAPAAAVEFVHVLAELVDHVTAVYPGARIELVSRLETPAGQHTGNGGATVDVRVDGAARHDPDGLGGRRAAAAAEQLARCSRYGVALRRPLGGPPPTGSGLVASVHCPPAAVTVDEPVLPPPELRVDRTGLSSYDLGTDPSLSLGIGRATNGTNGSSSPATNSGATNWDAANWDATKPAATNWDATNSAATNWDATNSAATNWDATKPAATNWDATKPAATNWDATNSAATNSAATNSAATNWDATKPAATNWDATNSASTNSGTATSAAANSGASHSPASHSAASNGAASNSTGESSNGSVRPSLSFDDAPAYRPSSSSQVDELFGPLLDLPLEPIDDRYATPIFEAIASAWFREDEAGGGTGRSDALDWKTPQDDEWREAAARAARSDEPAPSTTSSGLPRRQPGNQLVPPPRSSERNGQNGTRPAAPAERAPDRVRDRLSTYQRGLREGRHRAVGSDGAPEESEDW